MWSSTDYLITKLVQICKGKRCYRTTSPQCGASIRLSMDYVFVLPIYVMHKQLWSKISLGPLDNTLTYRISHHMAFLLWRQKLTVMLFLLNMIQRYARVQRVPMHVQSLFWRKESAVEPHLLGTASVCAHV